MKQLTDDELNRFCAEKIMNWTFVDKYTLNPLTTPMCDAWFDGEEYVMRIDDWAPLTDPTSCESLLVQMAKKWCTELSSRSVTVDGIIIQRWDCFFWEPNIDIVSRNGATYHGEIKRAIVIAAWKAETGQFFKPEPQTGYNHIIPDGKIVFDDMHTEIRNLPPEEVQKRLEKAAERFRNNWLIGEEE